MKDTKFLYMNYILKIYLFCYKYFFISIIFEKLQNRVNLPNFILRYDYRVKLKKKFKKLIFKLILNTHFKKTGKKCGNVQLRRLKVYHQCLKFFFIHCNIFFDMKIWQFFNEILSEFSYFILLEIKWQHLKNAFSIWA